MARNGFKQARAHRRWTAHRLGPSANVAGPPKGAATGLTRMRRRLDRITEPDLCEGPAPDQARPTFSLEHQMRLALATAFAVIVLPATALSQGARIEALSLQSGARARILAPTAGSKYELITVASASPDSLRYSLDPSLATKSLAWQQISKMDASIGRHTNVGRGAGIGFLVGLIGGAALGAHETYGGTRDYNELRALGIVEAGLTMGALGGFGGAVIGHAERTEDWVPSYPAAYSSGLESKAD